MKNNFARIFKTVNTQSLSAGFTLIELLVAMSLTLIVTSLSGFGLVTMMTSNSKAEAKSQRRTEINRALNFISDEIRMARRVNTTSVLTNTTTTAALAVVSSNTAKVFNPSIPEIDITDTSDLAKIGLYLEIPIPIIASTPATCPTGNANAGLAPPKDDRVVYYTLSSTNDDPWLNPRLLVRYGRTPGIDGTIDPCSMPGKETFVDAISSTNINPACDTPAILSGTAGFYTCVNGRTAEVFLRSKVSATANENVRTKAFSRIPPFP